jgi:hypothetical protein
LETIADRLAAVRAETGLATRDFARVLKERTGLSLTHTTIAAYENVEGTAKVPAAYVAAVSRAFNKSPSWLLFGEHGLDWVPKGEAEQQLKQVREMLQMPPGSFGKMPPGDKDGDAGAGGA